MNLDIKNHIKNCSTFLGFLQIQLKEKIIHHETLHNRNYLCIIDYHSKVLVIKRTEDLSADSMILECKFFFRILLTQENNV